MKFRMWKKQLKEHQNSKSLGTNEIKENTNSNQNTKKLTEI